MTGFITRSGPDGHEIIVNTDNDEHYKHIQAAARLCIDGGPWISVYKRMPEHDLPEDSNRLSLKVLVAIQAENGRYTIRTQTRERRKFYGPKRFGNWFWGKNSRGTVTHWMPLPEVPHD